MVLCYRLLFFIMNLSNKTNGAGCKVKGAGCHVSNLIRF